MFAPELFCCPPPVRQYQPELQPARFWGWDAQTVGFNPFTAMLATPSLRKWPVKVPNLKWLRFFPLFRWAREKIAIKMHSTDSRSVTGPSNILFAGVCMCALFSPETVQAVAVKGLILNCQLQNFLCLILKWSYAFNPHTAFAHKEQVSHFRLKPDYRLVTRG